MKPHAAPAAIPAKIITGIKIQPGVSGASTGHNTIALAPHAPIMNCPSAPMFHNFMRKAIEQASDVRMIGVALTIVSDSTPMSPKDAEAICTYDFHASPPTNSITMPPNIKAMIMAPMDIAAGYQTGGSSNRGSRRTRKLVRRFCMDVDSAMPHPFLLDLLQQCTCHHQTNRFNLTLVWFHRFDLYLPHNFPFVNHVNAV